VRRGPGLATRPLGFSHAGRAGADDGREVDHPSADPLPGGYLAVRTATCGDRRAWRQRLSFLSASVAGGSCGKPFDWRQLLNAFTIASADPITRPVRWLSVAMVLMRSMILGHNACPIRLHDARHSCGTALHLRGVPLAVIAKWLGHADAATTARIYAHSQDDALRAAGQSLGGVVTSS
jgi:hypothetical protein